jgi:hypothetical protein
MEGHNPVDKVTSSIHSDRQSARTPMVSQIYCTLVQGGLDGVAREHSRVQCLCDVTSSLVRQPILGCALFQYSNTIAVRFLGLRRHLYPFSNLTNIFSLVALLCLPWLLPRMCRWLGCKSLMRPKQPFYMSWLLFGCALLCVGSPTMCKRSVQPMVGSSRTGPRDNGGPHWRQRHRDTTQQLTMGVKTVTRLPSNFVKGVSQ